MTGNKRLWRAMMEAIEKYAADATCPTSDTLRGLEAAKEEIESLLEAWGPQ